MTEGLLERRKAGVRFTIETVQTALDIYPGLACCCQDGVVTAINQHGHDLLGARDNGSVVGRQFEEVLAPEYRGLDLLYQIVEEDQTSLAFIETHDGQHISVKLQSQWARELGAKTLVVMAEDITERQDLSYNIYQSERRFRALVDSALDMICSIEDGKISFINKAGVELLGGENTQDFIGRTVRSLFHRDYRHLFNDMGMVAELSENSPLFPAKLALDDGSSPDVHVAFTKEPGQHRRYILEVRDITEHHNAVMALYQLNTDLEAKVERRTAALTEEIDRRRGAEAKLLELATHDSLTALPNRRLLTDRIEKAIAQAQRQDQIVAVLFLDLDGFKAINDDHGHEAGDVVLQVVAERLREQVRGVDTVARLGGDEFVVCYLNLANEDQVKTLVERLTASIEEPIVLPFGIAVRVGASIGTALYPKDGKSAEALLNQSDASMYESKRGRKRSIRMS